jgi:hypothetical protein
MDVIQGRDARHGAVTDAQLSGDNRVGFLGMITDVFRYPGSIGILVHVASLDFLVSSSSL